MTESQTKLSSRSRMMLAVLAQLHYERDQTPGRDTVTVLQHSLQCAHWATAHGASPEQRFVALIHDAMRTLGPVYHGEAIAELVRDRVSVNGYMMLRTHGCFQSDLVHGERLTTLWRHESWYGDAKKLADWEARSFDPNFPSLSLSSYTGLVERFLKD